MTPFETFSSGFLEISVKIALALLTISFIIMVP